MLSNIVRSSKSSLKSVCKTATCTQQVRFQSNEVKDHMGSYDHAYDDYQVARGESRRAFTYLTLGGARFLYATGARLAAMKFVASISASADVLALAAMEVDVTKIQPGSTITVKWRGKPVFIRNRTAEEIAEAEECDTSELRDVQTDAERLSDASKPEWLVVLGVCTHLGCVPLPNQGIYKGWFCPCHGSHYDTSGRIRKGPAPLNLEVPPWSFVSDSILKLG
jgi:ubiquinol-cytochrome c reductase iron-sulfur subunit